LKYLLETTFASLTFLMETLVVHTLALTPKQPPLKQLSISGGTLSRLRVVSAPSGHYLMDSSGQTMPHPFCEAPGPRKLLLLQSVSIQLKGKVNSNRYVGQETINKPVEYTAFREQVHSYGVYICTYGICTVQ